MLNLETIFEQLKRERDRTQKELDHLDDAISAFGKVVGKAGRQAAARTEKTVRRARRTLSAEARKRISQAQKMRWAKVKRSALKKLS